MKKFKLLSILLMILVCVFSSACTDDDEWFNNGKYGTFKMTLKNADAYIDSVEVVDENTKLWVDENESTKITPTTFTTNSKGGVFSFIFALVLNHRITDVPEDVVVEYVINLKASIYDKSGGYIEKEWENMIVKFVVNSGTKYYNKHKKQVIVGVSKIDLSYPDVSRCLSVSMTPLYIKEISGKVFIDRPADEISGEAV